MSIWLTTRYVIGVRCLMFVKYFLHREANS